MISIRSYISKDLVFGAIGGSILATIFTSIIDGIETNIVKEELDISKEQLGILAADLEKMTVLGKKAMDDQDEVVKAQGLKIQELEDELKKYILKEVKEKEEQDEKEKVKEIIDSGKRNKWDEVYRLTEHWYNHTPCQMSRSEVFTNLEKDGYITQEERTEAYNYFGSLWNYVGD